MAVPGHSCANEMSRFFKAYIDKTRAYVNLGEAGCDYVVHNSSGLSFDEPLIKSLNYNELVTTSMYALMLSQNHINTNTVPDNYLAEDLVDFIYQAGLYHHILNTYGTKDTKKEEIDKIDCEQCRKYLQTMLNDEGKLKMKENNKKINHNTNTGKRWYNDGTKSYLKKTCPDGCVPGRLPCK